MTAPLLMPVEKALVLFATETNPGGYARTTGGPSTFIALHNPRGKELQVRKFTVGRDAAHTDTLFAEDSPAGSVAALAGITRPLTSTPVPGREDIDGTSEHYLFYQDDRGVLLYRTIATGHAAPYIITLVTKERAVPSHWPSWAMVGRPAAIVTVPGRINIEGKNEQYVLHYDSKSRLLYRTTSVSRDAAHTDALVVDDRLVANWWEPSLKGVDDLAEIVPVPGTNDQLYVIHRGKKQLMYRKISVQSDAAHTDALVTEDRLVADWWTGSLKGIS